jgi:hypothetical protein
VNYYLAAVPEYGILTVCLRCLSPIRRTAMPETDTLRGATIGGVFLVPRHSPPAYPLLYRAHRIPQIQKHATSTHTLQTEKSPRCHQSNLHGHGVSESERNTGGVPPAPCLQRATNPARHTQAIPKSRIASTSLKEHYAAMERRQCRRVDNRTNSLVALVRFQPLRR